MTITIEQLDSSLDQDITLCSFAQAFSGEVMSGAIKYNPKYSIYKFVAGGEVVVKSAGAFVVLDYYNEYYDAVISRKELA